MRETRVLRVLLGLKGHRAFGVLRVLPDLKDRRVKGVELVWQVQEGYKESKAFQAHEVRRGRQVFLGSLARLALKARESRPRSR